VPSGRAISITSTGTNQPESPPLRGPVRWPWRVGAGGVTALYASTLVYPRAAEPLVVLFGIDGYGWSFLFGVATALLTAAFIGGVVHLITRNRDGWWAGLSRALTAALLALGLLAGFPLALLGGVLSFKNSYREVGTVDGHAIVVQQFAGWRGADFLDAWYRDGPLVSFDAQNDSYLRRTFTDIRSWNFQMTTTATTVVVHYRSTDHPEQAGTLTLPRAG
jgi:hypothetical protein